MPFPAQETLRMPLTLMSLFSWLAMVRPNSGSVARGATRVSAQNAPSSPTVVDYDVPSVRLFVCGSLCHGKNDRTRIRRYSRRLPDSRTLAVGVFGIHSSAVTDAEKANIDIGDHVGTSISTQLSIRRCLLPLGAAPELIWPDRFCSNAACASSVDPANQEAPATPHGTLKRSINRSGRVKIELPSLAKTRPKL